MKMKSFIKITSLFALCITSFVLAETINIDSYIIQIEQKKQYLLENISNAKNWLIQTINNYILSSNNIDNINISNIWIINNYYNAKKNFLSEYNNLFTNLSLLKEQYNDTNQLNTWNFTSLRSEYDLLFEKNDDVMNWLISEITNENTKYINKLNNIKLSSNTNNREKQIIEIDEIIKNEKLESTNKPIDINKIYPIFQKAKLIDENAFNIKINNTLNKINLLLESWQLDNSKKYLMLMIKKSIITFLNNSSSTNIITIITWNSDKNTSKTSILTWNINKIEEKYFTFNSIRWYSMKIPSRIKFEGIWLTSKQTFWLKWISCDYKINMINSKSNSDIKINPDLEVYECIFSETEEILNNLNQIWTIYLFDSKSKKQFIIKYYNEFGKDIWSKITLN